MPFGIDRNLATRASHCAGRSLPRFAQYIPESVVAGLIT